MTSFRVVRANHSGACYGVQRALDLAMQAASEHDRVCTLGPLIHNPRVVSELQEQGVQVAHDVQQAAQTGAQAVVIRSHGVVPQVIEELDAAGCAVINATCPYVMRAQNAAAALARDGYQVLVVGEAGHPEVEGIAAHAQAAGGTCVVAAQVDELPDDLSEPLGVVVQTTQSAQKLEAMVAAVRERGIEPVVRDTICLATQRCQQAAVDVAKRVDVMLVLGGRNSSNTTRLFELCLRWCPTYHIESADEVDPSWFANAQLVGVTAGASTPQAHIDELCERLSTL